MAHATVPFSVNAWAALFEQLGFEVQADSFALQAVASVLDERARYIFQPWSALSMGQPWPKKFGEACKCKCSSKWA